MSSWPAEFAITLLLLAWNGTGALAGEAREGAWRGGACHDGVPAVAVQDVGGAWGGERAVGRGNEDVQSPNKPVLKLAEDGVDLWPLCRGPDAMRLD
jgi:hypothetical protein